MKHSLIATIIITPTLFSNAIADNTFGIGIGTLYNGLGINLGKTTSSSLMYGSLGCMGGSSSRGTTTNGDVTTQERSSSTNCGFGLGYISTSIFSGNKHGLGLNLGYTYNTAELVKGSEYHLMPSYHYFFNGIDQRGVNLGFGAQATLNDDESTATGLTINIGFQF